MRKLYSYISTFQSVALLIYTRILVKRILSSYFPCFINNYLFSLCLIILFYMLFFHEQTKLFCISNYCYPCEKQLQALHSDWVSNLIFSKSPADRDNSGLRRDFSPPPAHLEPDTKAWTWMEETDPQWPLLEPGDTLFLFSTPTSEICFWISSGLNPSQYLHRSIDASGRSWCF